MDYLEMYYLISKYLGTFWITFIIDCYFNFVMAQEMCMNFIPLNLNLSYWPHSSETYKKTFIKIVASRKDLNLKE